MRLADSIRRAHATGGEVRGFFRIQHGNGWLAKRMARWSRLPEPAEAAKTGLKIISEATGERWERWFDGGDFITRQWRGKSGQLVERFGEWELSFRLRVEAGNLFYDQTGAKLCLGGLRVALPGYCTPRVTASEMDGGAGRVLVSVTVTLPLVHRLISYEGHLDVREEAQ